MILGQLFYYNKKLDEITFPIEPDKVKDLALMGVAALNPDEIQAMSLVEVQRSIRDKFTSAFLDILKKNDSKFAFTFWENLISPLRNSQAKKSLNLIPKTNFQKSLINWVNQDFDINFLEDLLKEAKYSTDETDFALYYALKVVSKLSSLNQKTKSDSLGSTNLKENLSDFANITTTSQIIVITQDYLSPLFTNLNCVYVPIANENRQTLENINFSLLENLEVKTILVNSSDKKLFNFLKKHLTNNLFVAQLDLDNSESEGFFDKITKKTLGIKLTVD